MLRIILKRQIKEGGLLSEGFETMDVDMPELEEKLKRGGFSENSYDYTTLVGIETDINKG
jgi:hypothetical protein